MTVPEIVPPDPADYQQEYARGRRKVLQLVDRLIVDPVDAETYADFRQYLDTDATRVLRARAELRRGSSPQSVARLMQVVHPGLWES